MHLRRWLAFGTAALAYLACRGSGKTDQGAGAQTATSGVVAVQPAASCPGYAAATRVRVSTDSIGPIPLDSGLGFVARLCPAYQSQEDYLETTKILDWVFEINGVRAAATQFGSSIDTSKRAEQWMVGGDGIILSGDVQLPHTWGELREHYRGEAKLELGDLGPLAQICELPGMRFSLSFSYREADSDTMTAASIPPTARIESILVYPSDRSTPC